MKTTWASAFAAAVLIAGASACSSSVTTPDTGGNPAPACDRQCQENLAEADGTSLPAGPAFDIDTSRCSLWNQEPNVVRYYLAGVYAERMGAKNPGFTLQHSVEQGIDAACAGYTGDTVKSVVTTLVSVDESWPSA